MHKQINLVGNRGAPSIGTPRVPSGCQQIDLFMHFLGARVKMASIEMDKISSSALTLKGLNHKPTRHSLQLCIVLKTLPKTYIFGRLPAVKIISQSAICRGYSRAACRNAGILFF